MSRQVEPLGLTITEAAAALGATRTPLSELVAGKRGPEMPPIRLANCHRETFPGRHFKGRAGALAYLSKSVHNPPAPPA
ncbi:MAG: hypothetical protein DMG39_06355 [Acidobacteria bacterium]|nr:MAG: hypothetical protein DMG39_06355 [Acidobacteriota bacterium]